MAWDSTLRNIIGYTAVLVLFGNGCGDTGLESEFGYGKDLAIPSSGLNLDLMMARDPNTDIISIALQDIAEHSLDDISSKCNADSFPKDVLDSELLINVFAAGNKLLCTLKIEDPSRGRAERFDPEGKILWRAEFVVPKITFKVKLPYFSEMETIRIYRLNEKTLSVESVGEFGDLKPTKGPIDLQNKLGVNKVNAGNVRTKYYINNGENRINIIVLGDGFTAGEQNVFSDNAKAMVDSLFAEEPFRGKKSQFNVILMEIDSQESCIRGENGGDYHADPCQNPLKSYFYGGILHSDLTEVDLYVNDYIEAGSRTYGKTFKTVLANTEKWGGSANSVTNVTSLASKDGYSHEFGHLFGRLGDEYNYSQTSNDELYQTNWCYQNNPCTVTGCGLNITSITKDLNPLWKMLIDASAGDISTFEGAGYCEKNRWRAYYRSKMNWITEPWGPLNEGLLSAKIDQLSPPTGNAPTLSTRSPGDNTVDVAVDANIVLIFSEPITPGTGNIEIRNDNDTIFQAIPVSSSSVRVGKTDVTINLPTNLFSGTGYYLKIGPGAFKNTAGNSYGGILSKTDFNFKTAGPSDITAPKLSQMTPADNALNVDIGANVILTFNEPVVRGTGNVIIYKGDNSIKQTISVLDEARVTVSGNSVTVDPAFFGVNTDYYIKIDPGAFKDIAGNSYGGITNPADYNFRTAGSSDKTAPLLTSKNPMDNATNVPVNTNIVLSFNESVVAGIGTLAFYRGSDNFLIKRISVTNKLVMISGSSVTINPPADASPGTDYYIKIDPGAFKDIAGNSYGGITNATDYNFRTAGSK